LLKACASGDHAALHSLYRETGPQLFGIALGILKSRERAEDVLQDSFVLVWRHAHSFDPGRGTAMAWLAQIVRNRSIDILRQRGREAPLDDTFMDDLEDPAASPFDLVALTSDARRLGDCLDELDARPRKVVMMAYFEGMTYKEVASRTGAPISTVKTWIRRSLMRLRVCMER
jgi:RNA polymerase sigma-70 factor (ECF subfamily)